MIEMVLNQVSVDGMRLVRVISDRVVSEACLRSMAPGAAREFAEVRCWDTAALNLFYGEARWPVREMVEVKMPSSRFQVPTMRRLVAWRFMEGEGYRVSEVIEHLARWFFVQTHRRPGFAFMKRLPKGVECGEEVEGVMLLEAEWALERCVMVGG